MGQTLQSQQCLMTSWRIAEVLDQVANAASVEGEREFAVIAALKLCRPEYRDCPVTELASKLAELDTAGRLCLAREVHPLLCSLTVQEQRGESGAHGYLVQILNPRGVTGRLVEFDVDTRMVAA